MQQSVSITIASQFIGNIYSNPIRISSHIFNEYIKFIISGNYHSTLQYYLNRHDN